MHIGIADRLIQAVGSNANLNRIGRAIGLSDCVNNNPAQGGVVSPATMTTTVEAILGAIYLDSEQNIEAIQTAMELMGLSSLE